MISPPDLSFQVIIPIPSCLRNSLRFTLPPPPPPPPPSSHSRLTTTLGRGGGVGVGTGTWDLKIQPSLSNVKSIQSDATLITGSFPSCQQLILKWTTSDEKEEEFKIIKSEIESNWLIEQRKHEQEQEQEQEREEGGLIGIVEVLTKGNWEYNGLKDKHWVEIEIERGGGAREGNDKEEEEAIELIDVEGEGIVGWEIITPTKTKKKKKNHGQEEEEDFIDDSKLNPPLLPEQSSVSRNSGNARSTTPRSTIRYSSISASSSSSSSSTRQQQQKRVTEPLALPSSSRLSLFETTLPSAPVVLPPLLDLDSSILIAPSKDEMIPLTSNRLLSNEKAPFDPEEEEGNSTLDITFEREEIHAAETRDDNVDGDDEETLSSQRKSLEEEEGNSSSPRSRSNQTLLDTHRPTLVIRIQLSLSHLIVQNLSSSPPSPPEFQIRFKLRLNSLATTSSSTLVASIPCISLPRAEIEESITTVSMDHSSSNHLELITPSDLLPPTFKLLPFQEDKLKWSVSRKGTRGNQENEETNRERFIKVKIDKRVDKPIQGLMKDCDLSSSTRIIDHSPTSSIPLVEIEITPISPTNRNSTDWKIFYNLNIRGGPNSIKSLLIPLPSPFETRELVLHDVWNERGESIKVVTHRHQGSLEDEIIEKGLRITCEGEEGIRKVLYQEIIRIGSSRSRSELVVDEQVIESAALLPFFLKEKISEYKVKVLKPLDYYDLKIDVIHDFDLSFEDQDSSNVSSSCRYFEFTKFLVPPNTRPFLSLRFQPRTLSHSSRSESDTSGGRQGRQGQRPRSTSELFWDNIHYGFLSFGILLLPLLLFTTSLIRGSIPPRHSQDSPSLNTFRQPLISYSTITQTQIQTETASASASASVVYHTSTLTTTHYSTRTETVTLIHSPSSLPRISSTTIKNKLPPLVDDATSPVQLTVSVQQAQLQSDSSQPGALSNNDEYGNNSFLIWFEKFKYNLKTYLKDFISNFLPRLS